MVNADDFGFTRDVNRGIVEAHRNGILTATTIMAEAPHLTTPCGWRGRIRRSISAASGAGRRASFSADGRAVDPRGDARADSHLRGIVGAGAARAGRGLQPTHLDTHKHTHLLPPVLDAVARISEEFKIPWVRRPFDFPLAARMASPWQKRAVSRAFGVVRGRFERVLARHGCRSTDHFAGFQITGKFDASDVAALIRALPEGSTEFMCHPGILHGGAARGAHPVEGIARRGIAGADVARSSRGAARIGRGAGELPGL